MTARPLVIGIADLRRRPGSRRHVEREVVLGGLGITTASVPEGAEIGVDLELETMLPGLVATGTITVPWVGECRRCLGAVRAETIVEIREIFDPHPVEGETYPLGEDLVDLEPMVRDAVLLALPLAPLCGPDCLGPAPDMFPTGPAEHSGEAGEGAGDGGGAPRPDPRWAALAELDFDSDAVED
ncbi:MAG: DUF177 domain-containing protein [Acidobacteria bacterium]|nr:DUF177 domain-containing protein [Acidobacteriota bacterium]